MVSRLHLRQGRDKVHQGKVEVWQCQAIGTLPKYDSDISSLARGSNVKSISNENRTI